ncbi:MAG: aminotransferase class I/II-fold pyridoxal phosphate-dependent enzyme, partial [Ferruginibacter sp.]
TAENNFMPTAEQLKPHIKGAALVAICSPLNPTGTTFSKEELEKICDLILEENNSRAKGEKKLYLMFDQIYWTLTYGQTKHYDPVSVRPAMKDYTIYIDGISKSFASTGVRVGWALGPVEVLIKMRSLNSHVGSWAPMAEQKAVARFLNNRTAVDSYFEHFKNEILLRLNGIHEGLQKLKSEGFSVDSIEPQAAIYLTMKVDLVGKKKQDGKILEDQAQVTEFLLSEAKLAIVPFTAFGAEGKNPWYRLSVGTCKKEDIPVILNNLKVAIEKLS